MTVDVKKRIFDLFVSTFLFFLTLPIQIIIAITTFIFLKKNPFFIQERGITLDKSRFKMIKFRTLKNSVGSDLKKIVSRKNFLISDYGFEINPFFKFCRSTGLDELPQLINVFMGKMSLVGPRPLMIEELEFLQKEFPEIYKRRSLIKSKPGLTGVWQILGDRNYGAQNLVELDLFYENNKSFLLDLRILYYTFFIIIHAKNSASVLSRLNVFEKVFTTSSYNAEENKNNLSGSIIIDSDKGLKRYNINLPIEWWYTTDSLTKVEKTPELSVIQFRKDASNRT